MGYSTSYIGKIKVDKLNVAAIKKFRELDFIDLRTRRDLTEKYPYLFTADKDYLVIDYIDFKLSEDMEYIVDGGVEGSYASDIQIKFLIDEILEICPDFIANGIIECQGEEIGDLYAIIVTNNIVHKISATIEKKESKEHICPNCGFGFKD